MTRVLSLRFSMVMMAAAGCGGSHEPAPGTDAGRARECEELPCFAPVRCLDSCSAGNVVYEGCCACPSGSVEAQTCPDGGSTATPEECAAYHEDETGCASAGCEWIPAGCEGAPEGSLAGICHAGTPPSCADDPSGCPPAYVCTDVWINPCLGRACDACGGEAQYCLPAL